MGKECSEELLPNRKLEERIKKWVSPEEIKFDDFKAKKLYKERVNRIKDAIQLRKVPDRVPIVINVTFFPTFYAGISPQEAMYEYDKLYTAWKVFLLEFSPDSVPGPHIGSGKFFEILNCKTHAWPGHGVGSNCPFQFIEREYMKANEYDALIQDKSDFIVRNFLPRVFEKLKGLESLSPLDGMLTGNLSNFIPFCMPDTRNAVKALLEAGDEALKWAQAAEKYRKEIIAAGFPQLGGAVTLAPFDMIGNYLRGTQGIMLDMFRQPDKLLKALEVITPLAIKMGLSNKSDNPIVYMPLHKGGDDFLSDKQFKTFYWPFLKKVILELIKKGYFVYLFAEGSYNSRLEVIRDLPKGKTLWRFDQTDMKKAKEKLGDIACIAGNLPTTFLMTSSTQEIKEYIKKIIDEVGRDGGYIMCNGAGIDSAKPENVKAMIDFTKEYGIYN